MAITINKEKGWIEAIIDGNCDFSKFYEAANILEKDLKVSFTSKLNDFDTLYWDFIYKESQLTLHYNIYLGLSVFPKEFKSASISDNAYAGEIGQWLFERLKNVG